MSRFLIVAGALLVDACGGPTMPDVSTAAYIGPVISFESSDRLLVQDEEPGGSTSGRVVVIVTAGTRLRVASGGSAHLSDIQLGDSVAVWATGEMRSEPPQAVATSLVRLGRNTKIFER